MEAFHKGCALPSSHAQTATIATCLVSLFTAQVKPLLQVTNAEEQKREMEEEIRKLTGNYEKLRIEYDELAKQNNAVLVNSKQLEEQLREEKFLTQEAEEVSGCAHHDGDPCLHTVITAAVCVFVDEGPFSPEEE